MRWLASALLAAATVLAGDYITETLKWRQEREAALKAPDGWLTLVGLKWLKPGSNPTHGGDMRLDGATFGRDRFHRGP